MQTADVSTLTTTADSSAATTASLLGSPPLSLSAPATSHHPSLGVGSAGGSSIAVAAASASASASASAGSASGSGSKARRSVRSSSSASSKSAPTDESHLAITTPRIVYGRGTISRLPTELGLLRATSPLIVSSPSRVALARRIQSLIPNFNSRILDSAVVNVPARVVDDAVSRIHDRDVVISVGGASAVGLAKAIGCRKGIPHICIPTTYSGSEMMPLLLDACPARHSSTSSGGSTNGSGSSSSGSASKSDSHQRRDRERGPSGRRNKGPRTTTFRDPKVMPAVVIYDEDLATSMSRRMSAPTDEVAMARSTELRQEDESTPWSFIHLPGV